MERKNDIKDSPLISHTRGLYADFPRFILTYFGWVHQVKKTTVLFLVSEDSSEYDGSGSLPALKIGDCPSQKGWWNRCRLWNATYYFYWRFKIFLHYSDKVRLFVRVIAFFKWSAYISQSIILFTLRYWGLRFAFLFSSCFFEHCLFSFLLERFFDLLPIASNNRDDFFGRFRGDLFMRKMGYNFLFNLLRVN